MLEELWPPPLLEEWRATVQADTSPEWLLWPFVPANSRVWVTGPPKKAKKTWFAMEVVRALASGRAYGEFKPAYPQGVNCLVIEKEGTPKFTEWRWTALEKGQEYDTPKGRVWIDFGSTFELDNPKWRDRVIEFILQKDIKFVVIDSLAKCFSGSENDSQDVGKALKAIDAMTRAGASVMYLDHVRKVGKEDDDDEDIDQQGRGSSAKTGSYDTHVAVRPDSGAEIVKFTVRNRDGAPEIYYRVAWEISKEQGSARLHMEKFDPDQAVSTEVLASCLEQLEAGRVYKERALGEVWKLPRPIMAKVIAALSMNGFLERTATGWRKEV